MKDKHHHARTHTVHFYFIILKISRVALSFTLVSFLIFIVTETNVVQIFLMEKV